MRIEDAFALDALDRQMFLARVNRKTFIAISIAEGGISYKVSISVSTLWIEPFGSRNRESELLPEH